MHEGFLTPQECGDEKKNIKNWHDRGEKKKKSLKKNTVNKKNPKKDKKKSLWFFLPTSPQQR